MVNGGYQREDIRIYDYGLENLEGLNTRGPIPPLDAPFFSALGAAQVFGRFTDRPFASIVSESIGLPPLNLGYSGSGPSFFLRRPELIRRVNKGRFAIIQMMSGRSLSNSRFKTGVNQGVIAPHDEPEQQPEFAETAYKRILTDGSPGEAKLLREENRAIYVAQMNALLRRIRVPKILLYWGDRPVDYEEGTTYIGDYWGGFPHFVNRAVVDAIAPNADSYVEVVGKRGLPQALFDRDTGEPVIMWPEDRFPNIQYRAHNHYYPSPEMNEDVAAALIPAARALLAPSQLPPRPKARRRGPRHVLVHAHIHMNAGTAIDRSLKETFGPGWTMMDADAEGRADNDRLHALLARRGRIRALSSHRLVFPLESTDEIALHPVVLLRHPLLRARAIYDYERSDARRSSGTGQHHAEAIRLSLPEWLDWCLSGVVTSGPIANYQTRVCSTTLNGAQRGDWAREITVANLNEAIGNLRGALVGTVENLASDVRQWERKLRPFFPEIGLYPYRDGNGVTPESGIEAALAAMRSDLGEDRYEKLADANRLDLLLRDAFI